MHRDSIRLAEDFDSADEAVDQVPTLHVHTAIDDETIEFVDTMTPVSARPRRRQSSLVRRFLVGLFADSVKIDLNEPLGDSESVVFKADSDPLFDPKISDFKPVTVLGQGAYGKVILVSNRKSGKLFAQKQLKKASIYVAAKNQSSLVSEEKQEDAILRKVERTMAEREILSRIRHPFIVKLFYALQDAEKIYLYLEYVPGGELFHHLSLGKFFGEEAVSFYASEMTLALIHLHSLGIVYRDLKPENCLLDSKGHLVLTDFGLSKISTEQDSHCNSIIGTPEYMAPEVLRGENYSFKVDWWSLGAVVFDMLSGKPPFTGKNHKQISDKILKNKVKYPHYFSADAKELLNKLLNKNALKRMDVDAEFEKFKKMRFFRKVKWHLLEDEERYTEVEAPIVPLITNPALAENFDTEFTSMKISDYDLVSESRLDEKFDVDVFKGFSYVASSSYIEKFLRK